MLQQWINASNPSLVGSFIKNPFVVAGMEPYWNAHVLTGRAFTLSALSGGQYATASAAPDTDVTVTVEVVSAGNVSVRGPSSPGAIPFARGDIAAGKVR
jgi:hypothetical protein